MDTLKIQNLGDSAGLILPEELLAHLQVEVGEFVSVTKTEHGIELRRLDTTFEAQMAVAREVMAKRRRSLRKLAE